MSENNTPQTETSVESTQIPIIRMNVRAATETIQTPVDADLQTEGAAADAAATGAALALKADKADMEGITVNGQGFTPETRNIPITSGQIPLTEYLGSESVEDAIAALRASLSGKNGATLPVNGETGATSIEAAIGAVRDNLDGKNGSNIPLNGVQGATNIEAAIGAVSTALAGKNGDNIPISAGAVETIGDTIEELDGMVLKKEVQSLNTDQQGWVRDNIGLGDAAVKGVANNLTTETAGASVLDAAQGYAINQVLEPLNTNFASLYRLVTYEFSYEDVSSGANKTFTASDLNMTPIEGYAPVAVMSIVTGYANMAVTRFSLASGSSYVLTLRNNASSAQSASGSITVLYLRTAARAAEQ